ELCFGAERLAKKWGIPLILDVRDLWPDIFVEAVPRPLQWLASAVLLPYFWMTRRALRSARALFAVSRDYLNWAVRRAGRSSSPDDGVFALGYEAPIPDGTDRTEVLQYTSHPGDSI